MIKYFCDICGDEIHEKEDVQRLWFQGRAFDTDTQFDLCRDCAKRATKAIFEECYRHSLGKDDAN